jgi:hypothetical protein
MLAYASRLSVGRSSHTAAELSISAWWLIAPPDKDAMMEWLGVGRMR